MRLRMASRNLIKRKASSRSYYEANKEYERASARKRMRERRQRTRDWLLEYLKTHPCVDCGETDLVVLEFDHVKGVKSFQIGDAISKGINLKRVQDEVGKCEVRCANCHRIKTYKEAGFRHRDV